MRSAKSAPSADNRKRDPARNRAARPAWAHRARSVREGNAMRLEIRDNGDGLPGGVNPQEGVGLSNRGRGFSSCAGLGDSSAGQCAGRRPCREHRCPLAHGTKALEGYRPIRIIVAAVKIEPLLRTMNPRTRAPRGTSGRRKDVEVVGECANGIEAVAAIQEKTPDLVFLDVQMPELDGFGVLSALHASRSRPSFSLPPTIASPSGV